MQISQERLLQKRAEFEHKLKILPAWKEQRTDLMIRRVAKQANTREFSYQGSIERINKQLKDLYNYAPNTVREETKTGSGKSSKRAAGVSKGRHDKVNEVADRK